MNSDKRKWKRRAKGAANGHRVYRSYKHNAERRNLSFDFNEDDLIAMTQAPCHYCGEKGSNVYNEKGSNGIFRYNGIDRVDSSKGYSINNCVPCCKMCNVAKSTRSVNDFLTWAHRVYSHSVSRIASY